MSGLTDIEHIDQKEYSELVELVIKNNMNIITLGPSGTGKTVIPIQICEALKLPYKIINLSVLERPDLIGVPYVHEGRTIYAPPIFLPMKDDPNTVLILDELDKVSEDLQAPLLEILQFNAVNSEALKIQAIIATGNLLDEGAHSRLLNRALTNRALVYQLTPTLDHFETYAIKSGFHPLLVQFIHTHTEFWHKPNYSDTAYAQPCPRMWEFASEALKKMDDDATPAFKTRVIAGYVGTEASLSFLTWLEYYRDLDAPINDLLEHGIHPQETSIDKRLMCATAVISKLCRLAEQKTKKAEMRKKAANIFGWLKTLEGDIIYGAMSVAKNTLDVLFDKYELSELEDFEEIVSYVEEVAA